MLKKIIHLKIILVILVFASLPRPILASPGLQDAFKFNDGSFNDPLDKVAKEAGYDPANPETQLTESIARLIAALLGLLGIFFLLLMIYGGFLWMTDMGNSDKVEKARKIITAAIIGLIIVAMSYAISFFVIDAISKGILAKT